MAFASIIASAIGILLLIITAYVLVGGVLTTTQIAMNAQSDMTAIHMQMLGTAITIYSAENSTPIVIQMRNTGSELIDLSSINVFVKAPNSVPVLIPRDSYDVNHWSVYPDTKAQWRPTEIMNMTVTYDVTPPVIFQITTGNGVSALTEVK